MEVRYGTHIRQIMQAEEITHDALMQMLEKAAITSLRGFNRRYHNWLFRTRSGVLEAMEPAERVVVEESMIEECEYCQGSCCAKCNWTGEIRRRVVDTTAQRMNRARQQTVYDRMALPQVQSIAKRAPAQLI